MTATISRWGNGLGLRIPKAAVELANLAEGDRVSIVAGNGQLIVRKKRHVVLAELVERIAPENRHEEQIVATVGDEAR